MNREEQGEEPKQLEPVELRDQVEQLIDRGRLEEAKEIIQGREKEEGIEESKWRIIESRWKNEKGEFEQVIKITEEIITEMKELEEPMEQKGDQTRKRIRIDALKEQASALQSLVRLKKAMEKVEEGIKLIEEIEELEKKEGTSKDKERKINLLKTKGIIYYLKGELHQALKYYKKSLTISEELGNKRLISNLLNNIGIVYHLKGELDKALEFYEKSLTICEELGNKKDISTSLSNLGQIYITKGDLDNALEISKRALTLMEEIGNKQLTFYSLHSIGYIYRELGELEMALDLFKQCLMLSKEVGNNLEIAYSLSGLIYVSIDLEDFNQARGYLKDLRQINEQEENKVINLQSRLSEALVLKTSKRRKNLTKAEEILEEIVEEEIISHELTVEALVNLSELLLEELRSTGDEKILEELEEKVGKLLNIAKEQHTYPLLSESYLLKAQLALVRLDLKEARSLLIQAQVIAEEKGLERLARKISSEHDQLLHQLDQWEELIARDASIIERVNVANLEELMSWMARKREIVIDEPEDEPIMLLLVSEGGLPIYSKQFSQTEEMQDMLISGFLTSINAFVKEAFHVTGMIRRITHDDYTLSFNLIEPILFCYVYEGQSYTAVKKLEKLIIEVQTSEVWSALEDVGRKGYGLNRNHKDQMEGVIADIFLTN